MTAQASDRTALVAEMYASVERMNDAIVRSKHNIVLDERAKQRRLRREIEATEIGMPG